MSFKFYPKETHQLRFGDYRLLLAEAEGARSVLEFGPGSSTWAFIEAGVERIVCCEHDKHWRDVARKKFRKYKNVRVISYRNEPEAVAPELDGEFDLAFVDSPKGDKEMRIAHPGQEDCSRLNTCLLALKHSPIVLLHDAHRPLERCSLERLNAMGHKITMITGSPYGLARIERDGLRSGSV